MASLDTLQQTLIKADDAYNNATTDEARQKIASDIKYLINQINTQYPDYKPEQTADTSRENLEAQLEEASQTTIQPVIEETSTATIQPVIEEPAVELNNQQIVTNDTGQIVDTSSVEQAVVESAQPTQEQAKPYEILADFQDGRFVYQMANGARGYIDQDAGFSTGDPKYVESALAEFQALKGAGQFEGETVNELRAVSDAQNLLDMNPGDGFMSKGLGARLLQSPLFVGKGTDEALGGIVDYFGGDGEQVQNNIRAMAEAYGTASPGKAMAADLFGAVSTAIPVAMTLPTTFYTWLATVPLATGIVTTSAASGVFNLIEGSVSGYLGSEGDLREQAAINQGIKQGLVGLATGSLTYLAPKVISYGYHAVKNGIKESSIPVIQEAFGVTAGAATILKDILSQSGATLKDVLASMNKGGTQQMIADATEATKALTDAIAASGGAAAEIIEKAVKERASSIAGTMEKTLNKNLADLPNFPGTTIKKDTKTVQEELYEKTRKKRDKAYKAAYAEKVNYNTPEGQQILEVLQRMPPKLKAAALSEANDILRMQGAEMGQIGMEVGEDGLFKIVNNPNMLQLDYIKRALSEIAYDSKFADSGLARYANNMRYQLTQALKNSNKKYGVALAEGQEVITRSNAVEIGESAMKPSVTVAELSKKLNNKNIGKEEREMVALGLRAELDRMLGNVKATATKGADIQEMQKLWKELSSRNARQKLKLLIPNKKQHDAIIKQLDKAEAALALQAAVNQNSKTYVRAMVNETTRNAVSVERGIIGGALQGTRGISETVGKMANWIFRSEVLEGRRLAIINKELAEMMVKYKGTAARKKFEDIYKAVKDKDINERQLQELTTIMFESLRMTPSILGTQVYKTTVEDN